jgi:hypothetical protein
LVPRGTPLQSRHVLAPLHTPHKSRRAGPFLTPVQSMHASLPPQVSHLPAPHVSDWHLVLTEVGFKRLRLIKPAHNALQKAHAPIDLFFVPLSVPSLPLSVPLLPLSVHAIGARTDRSFCRRRARRRSRGMCSCLRHTGQGETSIS